jgi:glycine betaine/choline ABC-type transport system substrate-binding protein
MLPAVVIATVRHDDSPAYWRYLHFPTCVRVNRSGDGSVADGLVSLTGPKNLFAAQDVIPLVYKPALTISATLKALSAKLTTSALLTLDVKVITDKQGYTTAARQRLQSAGLG